MAKDDWRTGILMSLGLLLGLAAGAAAGYWGAQAMPWWLLVLLLGACGVASWLIAKRLIRWAGLDPDSAAIEGAMDMVVVLMENGFRTLPYVGWILGFWAGTIIGSYLGTEWSVALCAASWPLLMATILWGKGLIDDWREEARWQAWHKEKISQEDGK